MSDEITSPALNAPALNSAPALGQTVISDPDIVRFITNRICPSADQWSRSRKDAMNTKLEIECTGILNDLPDSTDVYISLNGKRITGRDVWDIVRVCEVIINFTDNPNDVFGGRKPLPAIIIAASNGAFA